MAALVTILTVSYPHELVVIKGKLESEGIACYTQDELMAQIAPFYSNAIGGVKLQVPEDQVARALEILHEGGYDA